MHCKQDEDTSRISICIRKEIFTLKEIYLRYSLRKIIILKVDWQFEKLIKLVLKLVIWKELGDIEFNILK